MKKILTIIKNIFSKKPVKFLIGVVFILAITGGILRFTPLGEKVPVPSSVKNILGMQSPEEKAKKEVAAVTNVIRQSIDLPPDEKAVMATVTDIGQLKDQQFFRSAQNGDVVLMYPESGKALIYRPKDKRVIEFGAMVIPPASPSQGGPAGEAEN